MDVGTLISADFATAAVLISFGVVLGITSPTQLVVMTFLETIIFVVNEIIGRDYLGAVDAGDTIFVHLFGAYFGLTVARVLYNPEHDRSSKMGASYTSDMFSMVSTNIIKFSCTSCCQGGDSLPLDVLAELQWRGCGQR